MEATERYFTSNRVEITDGLRVRDYDYLIGTVDFALSTGGLTGIGGEYFDGWFPVRRDDGTVKLFNGERLVAVEDTSPTGGAMPAQDLGVFGQHYEDGAELWHIEVTFADGCTAAIGTPALYLIGAAIMHVREFMAESGPITRIVIT